MPLSLFCSYSAVDERHREKLETHLATLKRLGILNVWHFRKITAGQDWATEIDARLNAAGIIALLISPDFVASDYCYGVELTKAMDLHRKGKAQVIPIIVRPVVWGGTPFAALQALPRAAKPITSWQNRDQAYEDVARGIRAACDGLKIRPSSVRFTGQKQQRVRALRSPEAQRGIFCTRCGVATGRRSKCTGLFTAHAFHSYPSEHVFCNRCGVAAGERSVCTGMRTAYTFTTYPSANVFCNRCGVAAGERSVCTGMLTAHPFHSQP